MTKESKPVCWRTKSTTTGRYRYHHTEPKGLVSEALYSEEDVRKLVKHLTFVQQRL